MSKRIAARVATGAAGAITVHVAPETMYDLDAMQSLTRAVLGRCGCPTCHSGLPILFQTEELEFSLDG